jgi:hypothetical protein
MPYLIDSDVFIQAKNEHYGFDFCPAFWHWIEAQHSEALVFSVEKVADELIAINDELAQWATARGAAFFLPPDANVVNALSTVSAWATSQAYTPAAVADFLAHADYYLIAHALAHGCAVVTHEVSSDSIKKIKIPNVCNALGIPCMKPFKMLRTEAASFVLAAGITGTSISALAPGAVAAPVVSPPSPSPSV